MTTLETTLAAFLAGLVPILLAYVRHLLFGPECEHAMLDAAVGAHKAARVFEGEGKRPSDAEIQTIAIANANAALPLAKRPLRPKRVYAKVLPAAIAKAREG